MGLFDRFLAKSASSEAAPDTVKSNARFDPPGSETLLQEGVHLARAGHYAEAVEKLKRGLESTTDPGTKAVAERLLADCMRNVLSRLDDDDDPVWNSITHR